MSGTVHYSRIRSESESLPHSIAARNSPRKNLSNSIEKVSQSDERIELDSLLKVTALSPQSRRGWCPPYLRTSVLLAFVAGYSVLAALLAGLYSLSQKHQGLTHGGRWHYISKYGPTAVLTLFAAVWSQVEYGTKQLVAWYAMSKGSKSAKQSVLLDYLSPWNVLALPRAISSRHYTVALSISGSLLLKLLIVLSTGILVSQDQIFQRVSNLQAKGFSVPSGFDASQVDIRPLLNIEKFDAAQSQYPRGSTQQYAFQSFDTPPGVALAQPTINATVDTYSSDLTCQLSQNSSFSNGFGEASTSTCNVSWTAYSPQQLNGENMLMQPVACGDDDPVSTGDEDSQRFLICAMNVTWQSMGVGMFEGGADLDSTIIADPITCLICLPSYSIVTGEATLDGQIVTSIVVSANAKGRQISGLSPWQQGISIFQALGRTPPPDFLNQTIGDLGAGNQNFYSLLQSIDPSVSNFSALFDAIFLQNVSRKAFRALGAQVALLNFMTPTNDTVVPVFYQAFESRLCIQRDVFIVVELILCILIMISILLVHFHAAQRDVVSRDPSTIIGLATIAARSSGFVSRLGGNPHLSLQQYENTLKLSNYKTRSLNGQVSNPFGIVADKILKGKPEEAVRRKPLASSGSRVTFRSWVPFTMTAAGSALLYGIPLVVTALLLGLLQLSRHQHGVINLSSDISRVHYGWTLLPAAILLLIAILFGMFNGAVSELQPYYEIKYGPLDQSRGVFVKEYNGMLALETFWFAIRHRHLALMFSTLAALLAPFLTIVVSGLYGPEPAVTHHPGARANMTGWFNVTNSDNSPGGVYNNSDPEATTRIVYLNASYPQWTYSELALAEIDLEIDSNKEAASYNASSPSQLSIQIPSLRANMNCTVLPYLSAGVSQQGFLEVNISFPQACALGGNALAYCGYAKGILSTKWLYNPGIIGYWTPPTWFGAATCPTTLGIFGEVDDHGKPRNLTVLACIPYVETVQASATFQLPNFDLVPSTQKPPVVPVESSARFFNNDSYWAMTSWDERGNTFDSVLATVNLSTPSPLSASDGFFQALFQGIDAISDPRDLLGEANTPRLIDAVEHLYRVIMAQCLHTTQGRRVNLSTAPLLTETRPLLEPGIIISPSSRLHQSATATYILITLLSTMIVCALLARLAFKPRGLVSKEPTCIAARMELLAGSRLLSMIPQRAEWCSDKELKRAGIFDGMVLRLGWWGEEETGNVRYGIDIDTDAARAE